MPILFCIYDAALVLRICSQELIDNIRLVPVMHGKYSVGADSLQETEYTSGVICFLAGIQYYKSEIRLLSAQILSQFVDLVAVIAYHLGIPDRILSFPVPFIQISGMVDLFAVVANQEGNTFICRAEGAQQLFRSETVLPVRYHYQWRSDGSRNRNGADWIAIAAGAWRGRKNIGGQNGMYLLHTGQQRENPWLIMITVPVADQNKDGLRGIQRGQNALFVIK